MAAVADRTAYVPQDRSFTQPKYQGFGSKFLPSGALSKINGVTEIYWFRIRLA